MITRPTLTRRRFLGSSIVLGAGAVLARELAHAQEPASSSDAAAKPSTARTLVVVQLSGGNDGLNMVVPYADDLYQKARPKLRIDAKDALALDEHTGLHPTMGALKRRFDAGELAIVQAVGYPKQDRSHFHSMAIWHRGEPQDRAQRAGWLGRALDQLETAVPPNLGAELNAGGPNSGERALSMSNAVPFALARERSTVLAFDGAESLTLAADKRFQQGRDAQLEAFRKLCAGSGGGGSYLDLVRATAAAGLHAADRVRDCLEAGKNHVEYPRGVGGKLAQVARLIHGGMDARVYYVSQSGYDTHAKQKDAHANLLRALSDGLDAFYKDLEQGDRARDVVVLVFSEFGRRLAENGSAGTDHGTCGPMLLLGPSVRGGIHGEPPDLAQLVDRDPVHRIDFRAVYGSVLQRVLRVDPARIVGAEHAPLDLFT